MTDFVNRRDVYIVDGKEHTSRAWARFISARAVFLAVDGFRRIRAAEDIPLQYFIGTAERETNFVLNRRAVEANGFVTDGLFQISERERDDVAPGRNLFDLEDACEVMVKLAQRNLKVINKAAIAHGKPWLDADVPAYLGIAHNQGLGAVEKTIKNNGLDWARYKARNASHESGARWARYGDACISGGTRWVEALGHFVGGPR